MQIDVRGAGGRSKGVPGAISAAQTTIIYDFGSVKKSCIKNPGVDDFLTDRKSSIWWVWAAPGGRETLQKGGGFRPPLFWKVSRPPGAAQTPKIDDLRSVKK